MTDRQIYYPGQILDDGDVLVMQQRSMIALGTALASLLGTGTVVDGLACTPTSPASLAVVVGLGSITQLGVVDGNAYGSLPVDMTPLVKQGWLGEAAVPFQITAPTTPGQSAAYLIEATLSETDTGATVELFYNAANPPQTFAGQDNDGLTLNTIRQQRCVLKLLAGAAANTGTQLTPAADPGYAPVWVITVAYGQTAITATSIAQHPQAPFLPLLLPQVVPYLVANYMPRRATTGNAAYRVFTPGYGSSNNNTLTFTPSVPGLVHVFASINLGAPGQQPIGCTNLVSVTYGGNNYTISQDNTTGPMNNHGVANVPAGAPIQINQIYATVAGSGSSSFCSTSMVLSYMFVPT